jgi:hypothetical protein
MAKLRLIAFAAARGRIGSVVLAGDTLIDWRISDKAAESPEHAAAHAQRLFADFAPDVVVTEEVEMARHKSMHSRALITAIAEAAERNQLMAVSLPREHRFPNKYAEADALVERFPELAPWKPPKRRFYDNEPRNTVLFEALALADQLIAKDA